ncbi:hypothetical protein F5Y10DRAFT_293223 [Nemania abortiva]|nr:hypothetical protein F5Y10DRAFT_293223 [Nemania abortiva]
MAPRRLLACKPVIPATSSSEYSVQPNNRITKQRRNHHAALDWESKKKDIVRLYTTENRQAEDVIEILKSEFTFNTSRRQLFNKLKEWGIQKNKKRVGGNLQDNPAVLEAEIGEVEVDDMVSMVPSPSLELVVRSGSPAYSPDHREISSEVNVQGWPALRELLGSPAQSQQILGSLADVSPSAQFLHTGEIPLETLNFATLRPFPQDAAAPPWLLPHAPSPRNTDRSKSPRLRELDHESPSKVQDVDPTPPRTSHKTTTALGEKLDIPTFHEYLSLEMVISSIVRFATGQERVFNYNSTLRLKEDLSSFFNLTQSILSCQNYDHQNSGDEFRLVNSLVSSAYEIAVNTTRTFRFPYHLLPGAKMLWRVEHNRMYLGTSILDIMARTLVYSTESDGDISYFEDTKGHSCLKIIFTASTIALQIEVNQCLLADGIFSSIPRLSVGNIVPNTSLVFEVAQAGTVRELEDLFASGKASIRDHDETGRSLLHHSVTNPQVCHYLVKSGLDVDEVCHGGTESHCWTPLQLSYYVFRNFEATRILLAGDADPTIHTDIIFSAVAALYSGRALEDFNLLREIVNSSPDYREVLGMRDYRGYTSLLSAFRPDLAEGEPSPHPVDKIKFLLDRGSSVDERSPCGLTCLHVFFLSDILPPSKQDWLSGLIYAIQRGANVFATSIFRLSVSEIAYAEWTCRDMGGVFLDHDIGDLGSYRGDLWDASLRACGYDIFDFRKAYPRKARYTRWYTRMDFEALWKDREDSCPYWDDNEWPAALEPNQSVTNPITSQKYICTCSSIGATWHEFHKKRKYCDHKDYLRPNPWSCLDTDGYCIAADDGNDEEGGWEIREEDKKEILSFLRSYFDTDSAEWQSILGYFKLLWVL